MVLDLAVLISGSGSLLQALLEASEADDYPARVKIVVADCDAAGLRHARERGIETLILEPKNFSTRKEWAEALLQKIYLAGVNTKDGSGLVVSAGFMRILPAEFVKALSPRLINTHPALLPLFPGAHAVRDALLAGAQETGTSVHIVDEGVDTGPVIKSARLDILSGESEEELHERIKRLERPLLVQTIREIALQELNLEDFLKD